MALSHRRDSGWGVTPLECQLIEKWAACSHVAGVHLD
jgi:hypothetical protein